MENTNKIIKVPLMFNIRTHQEVWPIIIITYVVVLLLCIGNKEIVFPYGYY